MLNQLKVLLTKKVLIIMYSTVQKECKRNSVLFAAFRYFSMKIKEILSEKIFCAKFDESSKGLLF